MLVAVKQFKVRASDSGVRRMRLVEGKLQKPTLTQQRRRSQLLQATQALLILAGIVLLAGGVHAFFGVAATSAPTTSAVLLPLASVASFLAFALLGLGRQSA